MMYCSQCGNQHKVGDRFCVKCGAELSNQEEQQYNEIDKPHENFEEEKQSLVNKKINKQNRKWFIVAGAVLLFAIIIAGSLVFQGQRTERLFQEAMAQGNRYLGAMELERAEIAFLRAIEINPRQVEPYLALADIYLKQNEPEQALEIIERGIDAVTEVDREVLEERRYEILFIVSQVIDVGEIELESADELNYELVWVVLPTLEYDYVRGCVCGVFSIQRSQDVFEWTVIDPITGNKTDEEHSEHTGFPARVYDPERGLFGDVGYNHPLLGLHGMHSFHEFINILERHYTEIDPSLLQHDSVREAYESQLEWFKQLLSYLNGSKMVQRVDYSLKRDIQEDGGELERWLLAEEAFMEEFAVMYRGRLVTDFIFDDTCRQFFIRNENLIFAVVSKGGYWGIIDESGNTLIPFVFDNMVSIDENTAFAKYNGYYGILDIRRTINQEQEVEGETRGANGSWREAYREFILQSPAIQYQPQTEWEEEHMVYWNVQDIVYWNTEDIRHAELVDFNNSGIPELVLVIRPLIFREVPIEQNVRAGIIAILRYTGEVELIYSSTMYGGRAQISRYHYFLAIHEDETVLLLPFGNAGMGRFVSWHYYMLRNGRFEAVWTRSIESGIGVVDRGYVEGVLFYVNEIRVNESEFEEALANHGVIEERVVWEAFWDCYLWDIPFDIQWFLEYIDRR